jgi:hypothetical protein
VEKQSTSRTTTEWQKESEYVTENSDKNRNATVDLMMDDDTKLTKFVWFWKKLLKSGCIFNSTGSRVW